MTDLAQNLEQLGLNGSEIKVYLYLLEQGVSSPSVVAKGTGIARTNTYHLLNSLLEKGLLEKQKRGKRYSYVARDPSATLEFLEHKREAMEHILPDLRALHKKQKNKPIIHFYDGWKEVQNIYTQSLEAEEIHWIGSTESLAGQDEKFFAKYQRKVKKRGIIGHDILPSAARGKTGKEIKDVLGALYDQRFLDEKYGDVETDIFMWNDNIALVSFDEQVFGTVITNAALADTFRVMFKVMWDSLGRK